MCYYGKRMQLDSNTEGLITAEVKRRVDAGEVFYALDVTNSVKQAGGIGRHRDMAPEVLAAFGSGAMPGYEMHETVKIDMRKDRQPAFFYAPAGTDRATLEFHAARVIDALPPNAGSDAEVGTLVGQPIAAPVAAFAGLGSWINDDPADEDDEAEDDEEDRPLQ